MKACMVAYTYYESDNRVRRYAETLAKRGDDVSVIALRQKGQSDYEVLNQVKVHRIQQRVIDETGKLSYLKKLVRFFFRSSWMLTREHLRRPYDLIHVHSVPDFEVFSTLIPKMAGAKIILDIHDLVPEFYRSKFGMRGERLFFNGLKLVEKLSAAFADHVIISNHLWEKVLVSRSVPQEKCTTILNYPDRGLFCRSNRTVDPDKVILLYPGTLNRHQGLDIAIKAFARIRKQAPEAQLHIYGDGPAKAALQTMITEKGLGDCVVLHDLVSLEAIAQIMACSQIGIIPKRNDPFGGEAFSTKTLEFMAVGVPIIVSRTRIDSYYFDEALVTFFEPENVEDLAGKMLTLIKNPQERVGQADRAMKYLASNNWEVKKHIYLELVDSLLVTE